MFVRGNNLFKVKKLIYFIYFFKKYLMFYLVWSEKFGYIMVNKIFVVFFFLDFLVCKEERDDGINVI